MMLTWGDPGSRVCHLPHLWALTFIPGSRNSQRRSTGRSLPSCLQAHPGHTGLCAKRSDMFRGSHGGVRSRSPTWFHSRESLASTAGGICFLLSGIKPAQPGVSSGCKGQGTWSGCACRNSKTLSSALTHGKPRLLPSPTLAPAPEDPPGLSVLPQPQRLPAVGGLRT